MVGSPIAHSLSPVLHRAAYAELGLSWTYDAVEVAQAQLAGFVGGLGPEWRGLSLTMPLKRCVLDVCDQVEDEAATLGSANTMLIGQDGRRTAANTDVGGFLGALGEAGVMGLGSVAIVGAGATAASALAAAARMGAQQATVLARSASRAAPLIALGLRLGVAVDVHNIAEPLPTRGLSVDAVISTIPAAAQTAVAERLAGLAPVVFDVIYHPRLTPLVEQARSQGLTVVEGFSLLLYQAGRQVELMTGVDSAPLEQMRAAGLVALGDQ